MASTTVEAISAILGWTYMLCWTVSFYPQPILNIRRRTTRGFSIDFAYLNILGMTSYATYNIVLFSSPVVRAQYAHRYPSHPVPTVRLNDVVYALHGAIIAGIVYSQFYPRLWHFTPIKGLRCSPWAHGLCWGCTGIILLAVLVVASGLGSPIWSWLDVVSGRSFATRCSFLRLLLLGPVCNPFLQANALRCSSLVQIFLLGNVKAFLTLVKYAPQALLNFQRKSTRGLSILQFTLDLTGGVLSLAQLFLDSASTGNWSAISANPAKFVLGNITVFFDVLCFYQHFYLYRGAVEDPLPDLKDGETDPLLPGPSTTTQTLVEPRDILGATHME